MIGTRSFTIYFSLTLIATSSLCTAATLGNELTSNEQRETIKNNEDGNSTSSIWKGTPMSVLVQEFKTECLQQDDSVACIKLKVLNLLEDVLQKDSFKESGTVSIVPNENEAKPSSSSPVKEIPQGKAEARTTNKESFVEHLENYVEKHDLLIKAPKETPFLGGVTFRISPRNLDQNEVNLSVRIPESDDVNQVSSRGRKHKLKKILIPILVFVLLKAMTLIPLAIGVLSLKAFNALKLSFISFLVSISLAIFQLFKKAAVDSSSSPIIPFESYPSHYAAARNFYVEQSSPIVQQNGVVTQTENSQNTPYRGYVNGQTSS